MRVITRLEPYNNRIKVYVNHEIFAVLYKGEIKRFNLKQGMEVNDELFNDIMNVLYARARERALYLLDRSYKTEKEIRDKLAGGYYPGRIIEKVVKYLSEYNFINDERYAILYIEYKSASKSKKQIVQDLYRKGISETMIAEAFEKSDFSDITSLNKVIEKRIQKYDMNDIKSINKLYRYLLGKGYKYGDVKHSISKYTDSEYF